MGSRIPPCGRAPAELRYLQASLEVFAQLPPERQEAVRTMIARLARTPKEGMALYRVLVQQKTLTTAAAATGIPLRRLSRLRQDFFEQMPL